MHNMQTSGCTIFTEEIALHKKAKSLTAQNNTSYAENSN